MKTDNNPIIEPIDMTEVLKGYEDKWVILSKDYKKVLKSSDKAEDLINYSDLGIFMLVPNPNFVYAP